MVAVTEAAWFQAVTLNQVTSLVELPQNMFFGGKQWHNLVCTNMDKIIAICNVIG